MHADEPELTPRDPRSLLFELDYWVAALADLQALNHALPAIAEPLMSIPLAQLEAALGADRQAADGRISDATAAAMSAIKAAQEPLGRLIDLSEGRGIALRREIDSLKGEGGEQ